MKPKAGNQKDTFHPTVQGHSLEVQGMVGRSRSAAEIVLLQEGLGSVFALEGFPRAGCQSRRICAYSFFALWLRRPVSDRHDEALHDTSRSSCATRAIEKPILDGQE
jgi:hypothetical protein